MGMTTSGLGVMIGFSVMSGSLRSGMGTTTSGLAVMEGITGILGRSGMGMSGRLSGAGPAGAGPAGAGRAGAGRANPAGPMPWLSVAVAVAAIRVTSSSKDRNTLSGFWPWYSSFHGAQGRGLNRHGLRGAQGLAKARQTSLIQCVSTSCPSELVKRQGSAVMVLLEWQVCVNLVDLVCM